MLEAELLEVLAQPSVRGTENAKAGVVRMDYQALAQLIPLPCPPPLLAQLMLLSVKNSLSRMPHT